VALYSALATFLAAFAEFTVVLQLALASDFAVLYLAFACLLAVFFSALGENLVPLNGCLVNRLGGGKFGCLRLLGVIDGGAVVGLPAPTSLRESARAQRQPTGESGGNRFEGLGGCLTNTLDSHQTGDSDHHDDQCVSNECDALVAVCPCRAHEQDIGEIGLFPHRPSDRGRSA